MMCLLGMHGLMLEGDGVVGCYTDGMFEKYWRDALA